MQIIDLKAIFSVQGETFKSLPAFFKKQARGYTSKNVLSNTHHENFNPIIYY
nr:MAG TPA: hypothetical protein [Caudoviricetes sp.]